MSDKIVLMDGYSILNRAFYGVPDLTNSAGLHTNAVYGFCNIMLKILEEVKPQYLAVAFDVKAPTFRHEMYAEYKGTRKPMPQELHEQVPLLKDLLHAMGIPTMEQAGLEADDILGTVSVICRDQGMDVMIVSGDRDLLQLADEKVLICIPKTKATGTVIEYYYPADVEALYGVTPREFIDVKALMGDPSDNIPGVPAIGEKTAKAIIAAYHSIENAYEHRSEIKPPRASKALDEHYDLAVLSKELATIRLDCQIPFAPADAHIDNLFTEEAYELCKKLEFKSLLSRFPDREQKKKPETKAHVITELAEAEDLFERAARANAIAIAVTAEDAATVTHKRLRSIHQTALAMDDTDTYILPAHGFLTSDYLRDRLEAVMGQVPEVIVSDLKQTCKLVQVTEREGIWDAKIAAYLLNPLKNTYNYDDIARDYLGRTVPSYADLLGKNAGKYSPDEIEERQYKALSYEVSVLWESREVLKAKLEEMGMLSLYREIEMPLVYCLDRMEKEGVVVKREELSEYGTRLGQQIDILEQTIYDMTGEKFNINSPKQLGEVLFGKMKLPGGKKTKTGYSTAADVLEKLAPDVPVIARILEYRQLTKLKSTYADGLVNFISEDGRIHGTFNQTITATGRISSTDPNLQNIPVRIDLGRQIRKVFVPKDGCVFVDADYSQIELRVLAHMSGDEGLIAAYRQDQDIHRITASQVFHIPLEEVTSQQRRNAKAVNFGIVYGISAFGLSEDLSISRKEASEYIERYFATYPGVKRFLDQMVETAKEQGAVTTMYGRVRPVPELKSSNFMQRSFGERIAMNSPIQGSAADIMKIAMIRVDHRLHREGLQARIILQVHDELVVEAPAEEKDQVRRILQEEMEAAASLSVKLEVSVTDGSSWYETK